MGSNVTTPKKGYKSLISDTVWTIASMLVLNVVAQFVVYPDWARWYDAEVYGNIIYTMSLVNIFAVSMGVGANYARMAESAKRKTCNGDYNVLLLICGLITFVGTCILTSISGLGFTVEERLLAALLACVTMWRYYADVEYRLTLNYKGYFCYYLAISVGYLLGVLLFRLTNLWPLALLPGEAAGLILIAAKGKLFRENGFKVGEDFKSSVKTVLILIGTNMINNAVFNGDRILLQVLMNGTAVTTFYVASLLGKTASMVSTPINSVIIGHLAKYNGEFKRTDVHKFVGITLLLTALGAVGTWLASYMVIPILYPDTYETAKSYFLIADLAQIFYFMTNIVTTVLLRVAKTKCQMTINGWYAVMFVGLCTAGALLYGVAGFCAALLIVNIARYVMAVGYCYRSVGEKA